MTVTISSPTLNRAERLRRTVGAALTDGFFVGVASATRLLPISQPRLYGVEVIPDVPYGGSGATHHLADIWRPRERRDEKLPVVLYIHGGRFARLSKDTHWVFNLMFSRRGYLVVSINYRLAPEHRFPAGLEDVCDAYRWVLQNAERYGGDPTRITIAGESAGANLATALSLASCYRRPEPFARAVFDTGVVPRAVLPASGYLQITNPQRFVTRTAYMRDRLEEVTEDYLGGVSFENEQGLDLADPLVMLERGEKPDRPLPPFFAPCGTWDTLIDDTRRLEGALGRLGVRCEARYYPRAIHAFHGFVFTPTALQCWRETFSFLAEVA